MRNRSEPPAGPVDELDPDDPGEPDDGSGSTSAPQAAIDEFTAASLAYLPGPAGAWTVATTLVGSVVVSTVVYLVVAAAGGFSITAPGGPGFATGTAIGQVSAGQPLHEVKSLYDVSLAGQTLLQLPFWLTLALPLPVLARLYGPGITRLIGLRSTRRDVLIGLPIGVLVQLLAIPAIYSVVELLRPSTDVSAPARQLIERAYDPLGVVALVVIVGIGAPVFEELFYRGLTLRMMERRIGTTYAVITSSLLFAATHLQLVQLPGLFVFGVVAGVLAVRTGRLGAAIWAHVGFNLTTVALLIGNPGG